MTKEEEIKKEHHQGELLEAFSAFSNPSLTYFKLLLLQKFIKILTIVFLRKYSIFCLTWIVQFTPKKEQKTEFRKNSIIL